MIIPDYLLATDLTIELAAGTHKYIQINGYLSTCILTLELLDVGATAIIQSSVVSNEYLALPAVDHSAVPWEYIHVNGVEYSEVTFAIPSVVFNSPNILYVENSSLGTERIRISLRGNR